MPTFTYPGVYIEEISSGLHTITGVATSIGAFVGWAPQGPVTEATLVQSWTEYETLFGGLDARSWLGYAVNQFFANGGAETYIVRLVWDGSLVPAPGTSPVSASTAVAGGIGFAAAQIAAAIGPISGQAWLTVGPPVLLSLGITPATVPPVPIGGTVQFSASGAYSDGSTKPLPGATWNSSNPAVLSIASSGVATGVVAGSVTLTATSGLATSTVNVTVTPAALSSVAVSPAAPTLAAGETQQLTATGKYSDGTSQDLTMSALWNSTVIADATVSSSGLVTALAAGTPSINAVWGGKTGTATVTVNAKALTSLVIAPGSPVLESGQTTTFSATAHYSDKSTGVPGGEAWTSSNPAVATVDPSTGVVATVGVGSTNITGTLGAISGTTSLVITAATLTSLSVTPGTLSIAQGLKQQLRVLGIYSDGTSADLTSSALWTSGGPDAPVTPTGLVDGFAKTVSPVAIKADWQGVNQSAMVTVTAPVLESIAVTTLSPSILSGQTSQFTATGTYSDGSTQDVTSAAIWTSSSSAVATVSSAGLATAVAAGGSLTLFASNPGKWGNSLRISVTVQPLPASDHFNVLVQRVNSRGQLIPLESFVNLSVAPSDPKFAITVINNDSSYVTFIDPVSKLPVVPSATPSPTPAGTPTALSGGGDGAVLVPASDHNFELALLSDPAGGIKLLDRVDIFNLLCVPAETEAIAIQGLQEYCTSKRAFYIVDSPQFTTTSSLMSTGPVGSTAGSITGVFSSNSSYYFPWVQAPDPLFGNRPTLFPPCGFVAGIYAATDASRGVWKAPAGINASLTGVSGLQYKLTDMENGILNIQAVNCLREFKVFGDVVWGARTLQGSDLAGSEWKYNSIRRFALFLESSLFNGTQWVVFEPNAEPLWSQIRLNVGAFLQGLFLQGAFQGTTPQQAYFVKCDFENNPQSSIDLGVVNIQVGFAPLYPAEFVVIQIQQMAGQKV